MKIFNFKLKNSDILIIGVFERSWIVEGFEEIEEFVRVNNKDLEFVKFEEIEEFVRIKLDINFGGLDYVFKRFRESFPRIKKSVITSLSNLLLSSI